MTLCKHDLKKLPLYIPNPSPNVGAGSGQRIFARLGGGTGVGLRGGRGLDFSVSAIASDKKGPQKPFSEFSSLRPDDILVRIEIPRPVSGVALSGVLVSIRPGSVTGHSQIVGCKTHFFI